MEKNNSGGVEFSTLTLFVNSCAIFVCTVFLFFYWNNLPPQLPWFYSLPWGENQLLAKNWFALGLLILALITTINYLISRRFMKIDKTLAMTISGSNTLLTGLYLASFYRVVSMVIWNL